MANAVRPSDPVRRTRTRFATAFPTGHPPGPRPIGPVSRPQGARSVAGSIAIEPGPNMPTDKSGRPKRPGRARAALEQENPRRPAPEKPNLENPNMVTSGPRIERTPSEHLTRWFRILRAFSGLLLLAPTCSPLETPSRGLQGPSLRRSPSRAPPLSICRSQAPGLPYLRGRKFLSGGVRDHRASPYPRENECFSDAFDASVPEGTKAFEGLADDVAGLQDGRQADQCYLRNFAVCSIFLL